MERLLQGPIINNSCLFQEHLGVECLEQEYRFEEEEDQLQQIQQEQQAQFSIPSLEDRMPFLQMLQSVETPPFFPFKEPNFQTLLKLQHLKRPPIWDIDTTTIFVSQTDHQPQQTQALELESCVTHDSSTADLLHSPVKCETKDLNQINPHSNLSPEPNNNQPQPNSTCKRRNSLARNLPQSMPNETHFSKPSPAITRDRRKRKRTRTTKNKEEVESQRMTHIAVERNRRRQMNDYLTSLRSIMPSSYVQRGDQASIIGGAIDFVKELEQLLQSLEAQKRMRNSGEEMGICTDGFFTSQCNDNNDIVSVSEDGSCELGEEGKAKRKSDAAELEVTAIQNHVNLKIQCQRRHGQLLRAIVALEDLRLTVLHLNITSSQSMVLYTFNLKMEEDCKLRSTDEVAAAVHQIFSIINNSC